MFFADKVEKSLRYIGYHNKSEWKKIIWDVAVGKLNTNNNGSNAWGFGPAEGCDSVIVNSSSMVDLSNNII